MRVFKNMTKFKLTLNILLFGTIAAILAVTVSAASSKLTKEQQLAAITKLTTAILSQNHYRQQSIDDTLSSKVFDEYFKLLDPNNMYFTQQDIKSFEKYREYLDDMALIGDNEFAYKVYDLYLKRLEMYRKFAEERLKKGFDFAKKESFVFNRSKMPRAKDLKSLEELWRKKLKNDVLYFRLMQRSIQEAAAKEKAKGNKPVIHPSWNHKTPEEKVLTRLRDINNEMKQKDKIDILGFYLTALSQAYGPHSSYMSPKLEEDFNIDMRLSLVGIGAVLTSDDGYTKIVKIIPGGPAAKQGTLKPDDRVIAVAQENSAPVDIIDMSVSKVVKLIRGKEGTKVILTVLPAAKGINAVPENITIVRDKVILKESEASGKIEEVKLPDGNTSKIGVINLSRFYIDFAAYYRGDTDYKSSSRDVKKILEEFNNKCVDGVIVDLRNNGGGSLLEAINLTGLFIKDGPVVQVRHSKGAVDVQEDPDDNIVFSKPLIVLTNKLTSSASEIFSGAIKDYKRGIIIGDSRTYGKGTVLDVFPLKKLLTYINQSFPAGTIKYESAVFYRVNGESTQQHGVKPDIQFPSLTEEMEIGEEFNNNHLPWSSIKPVEHKIYDKELDKMVERLKPRYENRMNKNPLLKVLEENINNFRKYKERNTVSLNEEDRWNEYLKEKKVQDEQEKLLDDKEPDASDLCLEESVHIMRDYIWFSGPGKK